MAQAVAEKLEDTGPAEKKGVVLGQQREQLASTPICLCEKEKEHSRLTRSPDHEVGGVKVSESCTLVDGGGIRAGGWGGKSGLHSEGRQVPRR